MSDIQMDLDTNDLLLLGGDIQIVRGSDAINQDLQQTLQVWLGEWFLDTTVGIPFKQQILVKNPNLDVIQATLLDAAQNVPGVSEIDDFQFAYDSTSRSLAVSITVKTTNGQTLTASANVGQPTGSGG